MKFIIFFSLIATGQAFSRLTLFHRHHSKNVKKQPNMNRSNGKENLVGPLFRSILVFEKVCNPKTCNKCSKMLKHDESNLRCKTIIELDKCCEARLIQRSF